MQFHPYAETYPMLEGQQWKDFLADVAARGIQEPIRYRMVKGEKEGLDGRNRLKAGGEFGIECPEQLVNVADEDVEGYIDSLNSHRRHLTPEQQAERRKGRVERVAAARAEGKSTRTIAEQEGVSHTQVLRDEKKSIGTPVPIQEKEKEIVPPGTISPPAPPRVARKGGGTYPAKRPAADEPTEEERGDAWEPPAETPGATNGKAAKKKPTARGEVKDKTGAVVPDQCRDAFADPGLPTLIEELQQVESMFRVESWLTRAGKLADHYGFILIAKLKDHAHESLHRLQCAVDALQAGLPFAVCPKCKAVDSKKDGKCCTGCRGYGHVPEARFNELTGNKA